jgi:hypothetical protein
VGRPRRAHAPLRRGGHARRARHHAARASARRAASGLPPGRDQAFNAARVDEFGAGIRLDAGAGASAIRHALNRLLHERRYAGAAADVAVRIAAERPDARAAAALGELSHRTA